MSRSHHTRPLHHAVVLSLLLLAGCAPGQADTPDPPLPVSTVGVDIHDGHDARRARAGVVRAARRSVLGFERGGVVREVSIDEGDRVEVDQLLARVDVREQRARRRALRAQLDEARARAALAERTEARTDQLAADRFASTQAADESRFDTAAATAAVRRLKAALAEVDAVLAKSEIRAPYPGVVVRRSVDEGAVVGPGAPVLVVESLAREAVIGLPPDAASRYEAGQTVRLRISGETVEARVRARIPTIQARSRTVDLLLDLPPASAMPGAVAELDDQSRTPGRGAWLPLSALTRGADGLWSVLTVVGEPPHIEPVAVRILHTDGTRAFVAGALEDTDRVVDAGTHRVVPGQRVRLSPATVAARAVAR